MRFFIAGIMQGSHVEAVLHGQDYREQLTTLLGRFYPNSDIYDPRHEHRESLHYDDQQGCTIPGCRTIDSSPETCFSQVFQKD